MKISRRAIAFAPALALLAACAAEQTAAHKERAFSGDDARRIAEIEQSLPPAVTLPGRESGRALAVAMEEMGVPGLSIAFIRNGQVAWSRQYGSAYPEGPSIGPDTRFKAGSISKSVAALGALALVGEGKITLDEDVNARLTEWKIPFDPGAEGVVTLSALLSHTAGVNVHGFPGYAADGPAPTLRQVLDGAAPANTDPIRVTVRPGEQWRYSGGGYTIVQRLIEDVSGQTFSAWMESKILRPLKMSHSGFEQRLSEEDRLDHALAHDAAGKLIQNGPHVYPEQAAAGLWSTPHNLALAAISIQDALAGESGPDASALARRMLTEVKPGRALGVDVGGAPGARWFSKSGDTEGFGAFMAAYESGEGAIVMANGARGGALAQEVVRGIATAYGWPDFGPRERTAVALTPAEMARLEGVYRYRETGEFTVRVLEGQLTIFSPGESPEPAYAASADEIFGLSQDAAFIFDEGGDKAAGGYILLGQTRLPFHRLSEARD